MLRLWLQKVRRALLQLAVAADQISGRVVAHRISSAPWGSTCLLSREYAPPVPTSILLLMMLMSQGGSDQRAAVLGGGVSVVLLLTGVVGSWRQLAVRSCQYHFLLPLSTRWYAFRDIGLVAGISTRAGGAGVVLVHDEDDDGDEDQDDCNQYTHSHSHVLSLPPGIQEYNLVFW